MHATRVQVDKLLAAGKITEAEAYMEAQRRVFWDHGYHIRKLNQAYFAFYGAYADIPQGAAGEDPVGAAVRTLRATSPSLATFLNHMAWFSSYQQLKQAVSQTNSQIFGYSLANGVSSELIETVRDATKPSSSEFPSDLKARPELISPQSTGHHSNTLFSPVLLSAAPR
jgi:hypothetical protein